MVGESERVREIKGKARNGGDQDDERGKGKPSKGESETFPIAGFEN